MNNDENDSVSTTQETTKTEVKKRMTPEERRQKMEERNKKILEEGSKRIKYVTGETTTPRLGPQDKPAKVPTQQQDIFALLSGEDASTGQVVTSSAEYPRLALIVFISFAVVFFTTADSLISRIGYLFLSWIAAECSIYSISSLLNKQDNNLFTLIPRISRDLKFLMLSFILFMFLYLIK